MFTAFRCPRLLLGAALSISWVAGCQTAPKGQEAREILQDKARLAVRELEASDPTLRQFLNERAYAYAVFPDVGKGGLIVGGSYGRGAVFRGDEFLGYVELNGGSIGLQAGAKTFSEVLAFADEPTLNEIRNRGEFTLAANASATALKAGAAAAVNFQDGIAVLVRPNGGLMADLSVGGQKINFEPPRNAPADAMLKRNDDPAFGNSINAAVRDPSK